MNREGEYISIAAYFKVNGIKMYEIKKDRPIPPINFMDTQIDLSDKVFMVFILKDGVRKAVPFGSTEHFNSVLGITNHLNGEPKKLGDI